LNPAEDRRWVDIDAALLHYFGQIAIADPVFAIPAETQQDDLNGKAAALEKSTTERLLNWPLRIIPPRLMQQSPVT
jgi:hypothetical protein